MNARACPHVPAGAWNHCRVPGDGERWVECPCCRGRGVASVTDDLTNPPMVCPECRVAAVPLAENADA